MSKRLNSPGSSLPDQAQVEAPDPGRIECEICGKTLYQMQKYRGRVRCFACAMREHERRIAHSNVHRLSEELPFKWDVLA
jgi:hypothetical protein